MALLRWSSAFDCIEAHVAETGPADELEIPVPGQPQLLRLSLEATRNKLYEFPGDGTVQQSIWRTVVALAQDDAPGGDWRLRTAWLAIPALHRTVQRVSRRLGPERTEVEAEMLAALLAELQTIEPEQPDPGSRLLKAARNRAWSAARRLPEVPVADVALQAALQQRSHPDLELQPHEGALNPPLRVTMPKSRVEAMLLKAMADRIGLRRLVIAAARTQRGPRIGTLSLRLQGGSR